MKRRSRVGYASAAALVSLFTPVAALGELGFERILDSGLRPEAAPLGVRVFDAIATDVDLDGDPDLILNWHVYGGLELHENRGGRFERVDGDCVIASGLFENDGVPCLFADPERVISRARASARPGLYVWHAPDRGAHWQFFWLDPRQRFGGLRLELQTSLNGLDATGLSVSEHEQLDSRRLRIEISGAERAFQWKTYPIGVQLVARIDESPEGGTPPLYAGGELEPVGSSRLELWKGDPHGMAWLQVVGSPHPELYVTRGALGGQLAPPADPKHDAWYVHRGPSASPPYRAASASLPRTYARGRRVEWVRLDAAGTLALSVASRDSKNALLVPDGDGRLRDVAAERGLDLHGAAVQAWADHDGDGLDDLFYLDGEQVHVARNREGRFEHMNGKRFGLVLPKAERAPGLFETTSLRWVDYDADGDLDLAVLGYGKSRTNHLFQRDGKFFRDVSQVAFAGLRGQHASVLLDVDNDGLEDLVTVGSEAALWHNVAGKRFQRVVLSRQAFPGRLEVATRLDADGDGRLDLVVAGRRAHLLRNVSDEGNHFLSVELRDGNQPPLGAVVRAHYTNGRILARRLGSDASTPFSQSLQPLHFGVPKNSRIEHLSVTWPGETRDQSYPVEALDVHLVIERGEAPSLAPHHRATGVSPPRSQ